MTGDSIFGSDCSDCFSISAFIEKSNDEKGIRNCTGANLSASKIFFSLLKIIPFSKISSYFCSP